MIRATESSSGSQSLDKMPRDYILRNAYRMLRTRRQLRGKALWIFVHETTGLGSTSSIRACHELGWDPEMPIGHNLPEAM